MQFCHHAQGQRNDDNIQHRLDDTRGKPEQIEVEAVRCRASGVCPTVLERNAVENIGQDDGHPVHGENSDHGVHLAAEGHGYREDALVHEENGHLGRAHDAVVKDGGKPRKK